jgi:hypothetical protein
MQFSISAGKDMAVIFLANPLQGALFLGAIRLMAEFFKTGNVEA